jgi:hypothetical protein
LFLHPQPAPALSSFPRFDPAKKQREKQAWLRHFKLNMTDMWNCSVFAATDGGESQNSSWTQQVCTMFSCSQHSAQGLYFLRVLLLSTAVGQQCLTLSLTCSILAYTHPVILWTLKFLPITEWESPHRNLREYRLPLLCSFSPYGCHLTTLYWALRWLSSSDTHTWEEIATSLFSPPNSQLPSTHASSP